MKCPTCHRQMKLLFISCYCEYCEKTPSLATQVLRKTYNRTTGYAKWIVDEDVAIRLIADKRDTRTDLYWTITEGTRSSRELTRDEARKWLSKLFRNNS